MDQLQYGLLLLSVLLSHHQQSVQENSELSERVKKR